MDKKAKTYLIIGVVVLVFLIVFGWYFYHKGKSKTSIAPLVKDNPKSTDANNNPAGVSDTEIKIIADSMFKDMDGPNPWGHESEPYENFLHLSDTDFERVYNEFNTDHQADSGQTLKKWFESEYVLHDPAFDALRKSIMARFAKLNLV